MHILGSREVFSKGEQKLPSNSFLQSTTSLHLAQEGNPNPPPFPITPPSPSPYPSLPDFSHMMQRWSCLRSRNALLFLQ